MGGLFKVMAIHSPRLAGAGGVRMTHRDAIASDLPAIDRLFRRSFCDTFGHLYRSEDLAAFLAQFSPEAWAEEFDDPHYAFHVAEAGGELAGYRQARPARRCRSRPTSRGSSFARSTC